MSASWLLVFLACFLCLSSFCHCFSSLPGVGIVGRAMGGSKVCFSQGNRLLRTPGLLGGERRTLRLKGERGALGCTALQDSEKGEQCLVPPDLDQAIAGCSAAVVEAMLSGRRGMLVDVLVPELDPASRGFEAETMRFFCSKVLSQLGGVSLGNLRVYFQGLEETAAAGLYLRESNITSALVAEGRLKVESLLNGALPDEDDSAVILVTPANTKEDKVTREVRRLLSEAEGKAVLIINHRLDAPDATGKPMGTLPLEFDHLEAAYYVEALSLAAKPQEGRTLSDDEVAPNMMRLAVTRKYPGLWGIYVFEEEDQRYTLLRSQTVKPTRGAIMEVCKGLVKGGGRGGGLV